MVADPALRLQPTAAVKPRGLHRRIVGMDQLQFEGLLREDPNAGRPMIGLGEAGGVKAVYRGERHILPPGQRTKAGRDARASVKAAYVWG